MYTYKEAQKILQYYSDKVIGKTLDKIEAPSLLISELKIEELNNHTYNVFCYARGNSSTYLYRNINLVAQNLELPTPSEILEQ